MEETPNQDPLTQIGWATGQFVRLHDTRSNNGVGDDSHSFSFDGSRQFKWFGTSTSWGTAFKPRGNRVLGVAVDMKNGKLLFGLDGNWGHPMGVAFEGVDTNVGLYPAFSGSWHKISVNFGESDMKYGPPDNSFEKIIDVIQGK